MLTLILGGARSGKTRYAQSLCPPGARVTYVATARAEDSEMEARIARHRADRPEGWSTIEEPLSPAAAVGRAEAGFIVVDCLTVWLANYCWQHRECTPAELEKGAMAEIEAIAAASGDRRVILVSNEVGSGVVPENPVGRQFRDLQGLVNQHAAALAGEVFLTVAGIALPIKGTRT